MWKSVWFVLTVFYLVYIHRMQNFFFLGKKWTLVFMIHKVLSLIKYNLFLWNTMHIKLKVISDSVHVYLWSKNNCSKNQNFTSIRPFYFDSCNDLPPPPTRLSSVFLRQILKLWTSCRWDVKEHETTIELWLHDTLEVYFPNHLFCPDQYFLLSKRYI